MARKDRIEVTAIRVGSSAAIVPTDDLSRAQLNRSRVKIGQVFHIEICTPRNPKFNKKAHKFGLLLCENIDYFEGCENDGHAAIKLLQRIGKIECDTVEWVDPFTGEIIQQVEPRSLAFNSMSEERFESLMFQLCKMVIDIWWNGETYLSVMTMADEMIQYQVEHQ